MTPRLRTARSSEERGSALVGVLLLLLMMSALAAALAVSGQTETLVTRNHQSAAQARASAEAGLSHGVQAVIAHIAALDAVAVPDALDLLLADDSLVAGIEFGASLAVPAAADPDAVYEVYLLDEDDPDRGDATLLDADADPTNDEDGDPLTDNNLIVVVQAVGHARDGATVTLEASVSPLDLPAVATDTDLDISGNANVGGLGGAVHTNGNLTISGNATIATDATASGTYTQKGKPTVGGTATGNAPEMEIPAVDASDYRSKADYILNSDGTITTPDGAVLCSSSCKKTYGWEFKKSSWEFSGNTALDGTFYAETSVKVSGNAGDEANPWRVTIIAEGSIEVSGNPDITPDTSGLLFVTDGDLKISGNLEMASGAEGRILVHEQLQITGNPNIFGQILVENAASEDNLIEENKISGNPTITYSGNLPSNTYRLSGWREVR